MPIAQSVISYGIEVDWLLTWFPIRDNAVIDGQRSRAGGFSLMNTDLTAQRVFLLGQGTQAPFTFGTPISTNNVARGFFQVSLNQDKLFDLKIELELGAVEEIRSLLAPPGTLMPFMVNIFANSNDHNTHGTALSLHGTIATGEMPINRNVFASIRDR